MEACPLAMDRLGAAFSRNDRMLVLDRKNKETIVVDGNIRFTILEIRRDSVRVGVQAPKHIDVDREEIWEAKRKGA